MNIDVLSEQSKGTPIKLNADILFQRLVESAEGIHATCRGAESKELDLELPRFFLEGMSYKPHGVYVGRSEILPAPGDIPCLIVSVGPRAKWKCGKATVFDVDDDANGKIDAQLVFNILQDTYAILDEWDRELQSILDGDASITAMVQITAPLLGNPIALCNDRLEIEAVASPEGVAGVPPLGPVSESLTQKFADTHTHDVARREPFLYELDGNSTYCINIYKQETYLGLLAMGDYGHPFNPGDFELFDHLAMFVSAAAGKDLASASGQFMTIKPVFHDILNGIDVDRSSVQDIIRRENLTDVSWLCVAAESQDGSETLPMEYLCGLLESHIPGSIALALTPYLVMLLPLRRSGDENVLKDSLMQTLPGISLRAGVSYGFDDIFEIDHRFEQARGALQTANFFGISQTLCYFSDYALLFALHNSTGNLPAKYLIPPELLKLSDREARPGAVDYWHTLKVYLDNEMNATKTARDLFIHRATLQARLDRIRESIDIDSPYSRMYIRYCLYLYESIEKPSTSD